jgi:hypothetical protein
MMTATSHNAAAGSIARLRVIERTDQRVVLGIPNTSYQLHLAPTEAIDTPVGRRVKGTIRLNVWKVDFVSAGGEYVEPIYGRPRRVQGKAVAQGPGDNSIIIEVYDTPFLADLPIRWKASEITPGTRIGVEVHAGATFEPAGSE